MLFNTHYPPSLLNPAPGSGSSGPRGSQALGVLCAIKVDLQLFLLTLELPEGLAHPGIKTRSTCGQFPVNEQPSGSTDLAGFDCNPANSSREASGRIPTAG